MIIIIYSNEASNSSYIGNSYGVETGKNIGLIEDETDSDNLEEEVEELEEEVEESEKSS